VVGCGLALFSLAVVPPFVLNGGHLAKAGVQSERVAEALDVREDDPSWLRCGFLGPVPVYESAVQRRKEALTEGIIVGITPRSYRGA